MKTARSKITGRFIKAQRNPSRKQRFRSAHKSFMGRQGPAAGAIAKARYKHFRRHVGKKK